MSITEADLIIDAEATRQDTFWTNTVPRIHLRNRIILTSSQPGKSINELRGAGNPDIIGGRGTVRSEPILAENEGVSVSKPARANCLREEIGGNSWVMDAGGGYAA